MECGKKILLAETNKEAGADIHELLVEEAMFRAVENLIEKVEKQHRKHCCGKHNDKKKSGRCFAKGKNTRTLFHRYFKVVLEYYDRQDIPVKDFAIL